MPHIPVHPSAEKRHRQSLKRAERNRVVRTRARSLAKTAAETIATSTDEAKAREALKQATKVLYKAIRRGHKLEEQSCERFVAPFYGAVLESRIHRARAPVSALETREPEAPRSFDCARRQ